MKTIPDYSMSVQIVFICHDEESVQTVLPYGYPILFVGSKPISNEKVLVVRDLPIHIEHEPKFLTFTAWYAIVKNDLFKEFDYLCILEWDAVLDSSFESHLKKLCATNIQAISFMESDLSDLLADININNLFKFLNEKNFTTKDVFSIKTWGISSNQCLRRTLLKDFVEWYYPCPTILQDSTRISWYHERVYMIYLRHHSIPYAMCKGLTHLFKNSHQQINEYSIN
jgi:GR25 family glycosyltransferase involved in LPS biosynthesis